MSKIRARILVIEDDGPHLEAIQKKLDDSGFEVLIAKNGQDGLRRALEEQPAVIISDIVMPGLDGIELLQRYRDHGGKSPVIVLTNLADEARQRKAKELGSRAYMVKSDVSLAEVAAEVVRCLTDR